MNLWAISDLHLGNEINRTALLSMERRSQDWLILAGDVGDSEADLAYAFQFLRRRFAQLIWAPGNHELWAPNGGSASSEAARGEARYMALVALARSFGVLTPEDPYPIWPGSEPPMVIAPLFTLYDYSFRPDDIAITDVVEWAAEDGIMSADELMLDPAPYPDRIAWCASRVAKTAARLAALPAHYASILVNHYPLEQAHAVLPRIPRFSPWCGTRLTSSWHRRFRAVAVVYGHLHIPRTFVQDRVHFHEVSLGYPEQWEPRATLDSHFRKIL
jgi:3',5'-cyclic AMP phosphodiesterase CpdA